MNLENHPVFGADAPRLYTEILHKMVELKLPSHMHMGVLRHIFMGVPAGDFLNAVLCNNFATAAGRCDEKNQTKFWEWAVLLYYLPGGTWGSEKVVKEWRAKYLTLAE